MTSHIQARLDEESEKLMDQLLRKTGWTPSQIVREGLKVLAACHIAKGRRTIHGQARFSSYVGDLSFNKTHLRDFGR